MIFFDRPTGKTPVWHERDQGDWAVAYFDLELSFLPVNDPERARRNIQKKFEETVKNWARMKEAEGEVPTTKPYLKPGIYHVPEPECEDKRRFYIAACFKRIRPEYIALDTAAELAKIGPINQEQQMAEFFEQQGALTQNASAEQIGKTAKENYTAADKALEEERAIEEFTYKLTHRI